MKISDEMDVPDFSDMVTATKELGRLTKKLSGMIEKVAQARTVLEFNSDRQKTCFSKAVLRAFKAGATSTAQAEHQGKADAAFAAEMTGLVTNYKAAEMVRTEFEVVKIQLDAIRTLISAQKATLNL